MANGIYKDKINKIIIYIDYREEKSGIPELIKSQGFITIKKNLSVGDYLVSNDIVIERKTAYDFVHSLFDGRLFDQASRMKELYPIVVFIVEGNPLRLRRYQHRTKQILAALATLSIDFDARILYSRGPEDTAYLIGSLAKRLEKGGREAVVIHKKPKLDNMRDWQLYVLQSFPYIGSKTAEKVLDYYGSIRDFCNTSISDLARINGIGEKKAEFIYKIINIKKKNNKKEKQQKRKTLEDFYNK